VIAGDKTIGPAPPRRCHVVQPGPKRRGPISERRGHRCAYINEHNSAHVHHGIGEDLSVSDLFAGDQTCNWEGAFPGDRVRRLRPSSSEPELRRRPRPRIAQTYQRRPRSPELLAVSLAAASVALELWRERPRRLLRPERSRRLSAPRAWRKVRIRMRWSDSSLGLHPKECRLTPNSLPTERTFPNRFTTRRLDGVLEPLDSEIARKCSSRVKSRLCGRHIR